MARRASEQSEDPMTPILNLRHPYGRRRAGNGHRDRVREILLIDV